VHNRTEPAAGDIDGDGLPEIVAVREDERIMAFEYDSVSDAWICKWITGDEVKISGNHEYSVDYPSVTLADIDEDGEPEVIVGRLVLNGADGSRKWAEEPPKDFYGLHNSCVADLDLEGAPELLLGKAAYHSDGSQYWAFDNLPLGFTAVGNFDDDPFPEIVAVGDGKVCLLEYNGVMKAGWPVYLPVDKGKERGHGGSPTVADFDGDGRPEIGVAGATKYAVFKPGPDGGTVLWCRDIQDTSSNITGSSVFDFEGDGSAEVVYADEQRLYIFDGKTGNDKTESIAVGSITRIEMPVIADVDNDNNAEIVVAANNSRKMNGKYGPYHGIRVFGDANDSWVNTRKKERSPAFQAGMHRMKIRKSRERKISNLWGFTWEKK
jgi:hypothetical protein